MIHSLLLLSLVFGVSAQSKVEAKICLDSSCGGTCVTKTYSTGCTEGLTVKTNGLSSVEFTSSLSCSSSFPSLTVTVPNNGCMAFGTGSIGASIVLDPGTIAGFAIAGLVVVGLIIFCIVRGCCRKTGATSGGQQNPTVIFQQPAFPQQPVGYPQYAPQPVYNHPTPMPQQQYDHKQAPMPQYSQPPMAQPVYSPQGPPPGMQHPHSTFPAPHGQHPPGPPPGGSSPPHTTPHPGGPPPGLPPHGGHPPAGPPPGAPPPPPAWRKTSDGKDTWFINVQTQEVSWTLPPGAVETV